MKRSVIICLTIVCSISCAIAQPILADKVVAIIGDEIVLLSDVEMQYQQFLEEGPVAEDTKCKILNQMLMNKMMLTQAKVDSLEVTEDDIEGELDRRLRHFISLIGSKEKLEEYYNKSILEIKDEFREDIKGYLLISKMQSRIVNNVRVTPSQVKSFFKEIPTDSLPFYNAEVEIGQIAIYPKVSSFQKAYAKEKISRLRDRIIDGEDFGSLAEIYSEDGSAMEGGELGFQDRGVYVPEFEAAAYRLEEGEISKVVETKFGFHILELIEKRGEKINVRHILIKPKITSFEIKKAKSKMDSIRNDIVNEKLLFSEGVNLYSEDEETKNNGGMLVNPQSGTTIFEMNALDRELYFIIDKMEIGEISETSMFSTSDGRQAYRIVYLKSETKPHKANLEDDYHRIQAVALSNKQNEVMEDWLTEMILKTYINLDQDFHNCSILKKWLTTNTQ